MSSENVNEHECRTDFIDGKYLMEPDVFRNRSAIKIIAFSDDIEVVNPIGVKNKKQTKFVFLVITKYPLSFAFKVELNPSIGCCKN